MTPVGMHMDPELRFEAWVEAGKPDCPHDGDLEAMRVCCSTCTLKICEMKRKEERADQLTRFLWDLGTEAMQRGGGT